MVFAEYSLFASFFEITSYKIKQKAEVKSNRLPSKFGEKPCSKIGSSTIKRVPVIPIIPPTKNFLEIFSLRKNREKNRVRTGIEEAIIAALIAPVNVNPIYKRGIWSEMPINPHKNIRGISFLAIFRLGLKIR